VFLSLAAGVAIFIATLVPASAGAAVVGPKDLTATDTADTCFPDPTCTFANLKLPAGTGNLRSPISGTITKWRAVFDDVPLGGGPVRLQVLRRTVNQSGIRNDIFQVLRESGDAFVGSAGTSVFQTSLRIRQGDYIGFASDTEVPFLNFVETPGGKYGIWNAVLAPGDQGAPDRFPPFSAYLLYNATVR
jgi:hypothetical protein